MDVIEDVVDEVIVEDGGVEQSKVLSFDEAAEELIVMLEEMKGGMILNLKVVSNEELLEHIRNRTEIGLRLIHNHIEVQERLSRGRAEEDDFSHKAKGLARSVRELLAGVARLF
ncbi:MAG: hypothetical protein Q8P68_04580 [Candidatus Peregrinibacteria bacterium]|nr:hypothetical protein [Candidatus Peregrinibacteria bacterium]MDZ4244878.1 hypothetical protein [Candidatus Gracilibacteria bacterium]